MISNKYKNQNNMKKLNELQSYLTRLRGLMLTLIILCSIGVGNAWGAATLTGNVVYSCTPVSVATASTYNNYSGDVARNSGTDLTATAHWEINCCSSNGRMGANSNNSAKMKLSQGSYSWASAIATAIGKGTTDTYVDAAVCTTALSNVGKFAFSGGSSTPSNMWLCYSTDNWTTATAIALTVGTTGNVTFDATISSAKYAFVFYHTAVTYVTPTFTFYEGQTAPATAHTVTYMDDLSSDTETSVGGGITLPDRVGCTDYVFEGWTASWTEEQDEWTTTAPTILPTDETYYPTSDVNLYPVYSQVVQGAGFERYEKVTSAPSIWTGQYLITGSVSTTTYTANGTITDNRLKTATLTPSTTEYASYEVTLTRIGETSNYYLQLSNGTYLGSSASNSTDFTTSAQTPNTNNFKWSISTSSIQNIGNNTRYIKLKNDNTYDFRCYTSSNGNAPSLWRRVEEEDSKKYISVPNCCSDPGLAYGTASVTKTYGTSAFTNPLTNSHSVVVTYALSNVSPAGCVSINASTGQVTINGAGSATITASSAAQTISSTSYCADEASYTLTVNKANITPTLTYTPNSVAVGEDSSAPTVGGNPGSGGVTYAITSASPAGCATIDAGTGVISGAAVGSVTVTATVAATNNYNGGTATANVTITAAAYFPQNKTLFFEAKTLSESAWKDGAQCKAWFRDCNSGCGEAPWTYWQTDGDSNKKYYAVVIPSTGNYPYVTIQRFSDYTGNTQWGEGGAQTYSTGGGSNVIKSTCASGECLSWSPTSMQIYLRGDITNDDWASNIGEMTDQNGGIWSYTYTNYSSSGSTLAFKLYTNYNTWIGHTSSNNNATLDGMNDGSTYNITATYNIVDHSLVMSKTFVKGTVHFNLQSHGSAISDLTNVTANSKISAPTVPTDANYIFGGWYKEPACTNAWDFANDVVTETMTLYAKWYQVTLAVKDEDGTTLSGDGKPTLTRSGASLTATEAGNYAFKDIQVTSGTGALSSTSSLTPTITSVSTNITITATFWKPITVTKGTGTGTSTFTISATTVARGGSVTVTCAPDATHKNPWALTVTPSDGAIYTASASTGSTTISNITKNITVDLSYASKETYTFTFSTKSGYGSPSGGKIDETNLSFNGSGTVTNPLVEGQTLTFPSVSSFAADECSTTFGGWSTNPSCATAPTIKAGDELVLSGASGSTTYYAVYSQVEEGGGDDFDPSEDVDGDFYITEKNKGYYATNTIAENVISTVTNKDNASKYHIESVTVSGNRRFILSTLVNTTTQYLVMGTTGSGKDKQNTLTTTETKNDATKFEITEGAAGTNGTWQVGYNENRGLMYRTYTPSGQSTVYRFGNYAFSNASTTGYSLLEFEPAASKTYTTNPTCTETFTVTLTGGEGASVDVIGGNVKYNGGTAARFAENDAVSILATPTTGYSFSGWTITKEHGGSVTPASSAASTTFTMPADNVTVTATFSPILVSSLKLRAQQTGQSDKTGSDLTMNCYPKEGQTGGNDPLNHTLNVAFYEVLPADALDKTYTWSVRVKASGAADWTNVDFNGNQLNTNAIINYYNNNTGLLKIGTNEGTAEIKITANDASGVSAKVTITVAKVSVTSISVDPTSMNVYAGQKKPVTITFAPLNASNKAYKTGSYSYVTIRSSGSNPFYIEGNETEVVRNETVTVTSDDGSKTATVAVTVNPLPKATFVDIVQNKTDFVGVPSTGILSSTVDEGGLTVTTTKNTPTHADVAKPATGNNCEKEHLHLVGWILKDWADENPDATSAQIAAAGAGYFYAAGSEIDLVAKDGKTFYAVWAKEVTTP